MNMTRIDSFRTQSAIPTYTFNNDSRCLDARFLLATACKFSMLSTLWSKYVVQPHSSILKQRE